jgi:Carboxypeptidase regulatory-like domain
MVRMRFLSTAFFLATSILPCHSAAQQPSPSPPPPAASPEAPVPAPPAPFRQESSSTSKNRSKVPPFLILGTVFNEHALAFPGVQVKIRRKGDKKFHYDAYTNSRGEFAVRVPDGIEYEVVVHQKNYQDQSQVVAANMAEAQKRLTFKLVSTKPEKRGEPK